MRADALVDRRDFLRGRVLSSDARSTPPAEPRFHHISSAVVTARPERCPELAREIGTLSQTEIHAVEGSKIIVVMEGGSSGEIGSRLTAIALMDGVFSANLVFEQIEPLDDQGASS